VLAGRRTKQARRCVELIERGGPVALTDVVFAEILQGLSSDEDVELVERHLRAFPILRLEGLADFAFGGTPLSRRPQTGRDDPEHARLPHRRPVRPDRGTVAARGR
jgi:hypothetical protein